MKPATLNAEDIEDIQRLKKIWEVRKSSTNMTQAKLGKLMGITQMAISGYMNARWALNPKIAVAFAKELQCKVSDFSPSLQAEIDQLAVFSSINNESTLNLLKSQANTPEWPFYGVKLADVEALSVQDRLRVEGMLQGLIIHLNSRNSSSI